MNIRTARVLLAFSFVLLLGLAWLGMKGGIEQWPQTHTFGERTQSLAQFVYGLLSLLVALSVWKRPFARIIQGCWLVTLTIAGGLAPVVWGDASWAIGVLAAFAAIGMGLLILWLLAVGARGLTRA